MNKKRHGGKREGAGRNKILDEPVVITIKLTAELKNKLDSFCEKRKMGRSEAVRNWVKRLKA